MRCLALAQAWQDSGGSVTFAMAESTPSVEERLDREGMRRLTIVTARGSGLDRDQLRAIARTELPAWVVIDGYEFEERYLRTLQSDGLKVLLIDDGGRREPITADVVLNQNSHAQETLYPHRAESTRLLLGTQYVLLRREFGQAVPPREARELGNRVLITLGGSDPDNLTQRIIDALAPCSNLELTAILGSSDPRAKEKVDHLGGLGLSHLRILCDPPNMAELMRAADLAIIVAGGTLWELLASGCAVLSYSRNPVQTRVVQELSQQGVIVDLGETRNFDPAALPLSVKNMVESGSARERMTTLGRGLVDGRGAARVVKTLQQ